MNPRPHPQIPHVIKLSLLALTALLAYAPSLNIPLIADDYPNLAQAQSYGSPSGLPMLLRDAQFRLRSTSYWTMWGLWQAARVNPMVYHAASLLLHIANVWLLYFVAMAWPRMRAAAFWAALLFAVQEGHQEAVMWFSAINELLVFFFGMASLLCWLRAGAGKGAGKGWWRLELAGTVLFALALLSKESAVILLPLFILTGPGVATRRVATTWHTVLVLLALASIAVSRSNSFRFSDGSFSLHAPFWITWPYGVARVLWIWGWPAAMVIVLSRERGLQRSGLVALAWIGIGLTPYSFLTYSTQIPSRQTYLASAGLALLFGLALAHAAQKWPLRPRLAIAVVTLMLLHNVAYLWTKKRAQFLERAAPTEQLIALARQTSGAIWVRCFPQPPLVAEEAVHLAAGRPPASLVWNQAEAAAHSATVFCYRAPYR
ncbi:MAG TPA: hypothetical protein VNY05_29045 [Candidatus Acidoferrales bacterium]|nr:hypothetical protein [Candidatus Acidoferrales bacterium]